MHLRAGFAGAALTLSALMISAGALAPRWPTDNALGPVARLLDAFAPHLLAVGAAIAIIAALLGAWRLGAALVLAVVTVGAMLWSDYRAISIAMVPADGPTLRILFFNANYENTGAADQIVTAALATQADVLVFAEATALDAARPRLEDAFAFVSPCPEGACELLLATDLPYLRFWQVQLNPVWSERYAVMEVAMPDGENMFIAANHLAKPWLSGIAETELGQLRGQYNWFDGPVAVVGDFNMAPWSQPMRAILGHTGFRSVRGQPNSWPVRARRLGLPVDQIVVGGDVRVHAIEPFGAELGSNHLGFIAEISLGAALAE